jgi:hypothetical protein
LAHRQRKTLDRVSPAFGGHAPARNGGSEMSAIETEGHQRCLLAFMIDGKNGELPVTPDISPFSAYRKLCSRILSIPHSQRNLLSVQDKLTPEELKDLGGRPGLTAIYCETTSAEIARYALDQLSEFWREREESQILKDREAGKLTAAEVRTMLDEIERPLEEARSSAS